jgi:hypothetical protein
VRPRWGRLYGVTLSGLAALAVVEVGGPRGLPRAILRVVLALAVFAANAVWIRANRAALDLQEWCDCASQSVTVRVISSRPVTQPAEPSPPEPQRIEAYEVAAR